MKRRTPPKEPEHQDGWDQILEALSKEWKISQKDAFHYALRDFPEVMSIEQVGRALQVSTKTVYKYINDGQLECLKVGRAYRVPKVCLFAYLFKNAQGSKKTDSDPRRKKSK